MKHFAGAGHARKAGQAGSHFRHVKSIAQPFGATSRFPYARAGTFGRASVGPKNPWARLPEWVSIGVQSIARAYASDLAMAVGVMLALQLVGVLLMANALIALQ